MKRLSAIVFCLSILAAACGQAGTDSSTDVGTEPAVDAESATEPATPDPDPDDPAVVPDDETADPGFEPEETQNPPVPEGPAVPDVTFELADGTTFVLADAPRPIMFVFWAEW